MDLSSARHSQCGEVAGETTACGRCAEESWSRMIAVSHVIIIVVNGTKLWKLRQSQSISARQPQLSSRITLEIERRTLSSP